MSNDLYYIQCQHLHLKRVDFSISISVHLCLASTCIPILHFRNHEGGVSQNDTLRQRQKENCLQYPYPTLSILFPLYAAPNTSE